jgi:AhpD family alkylhydroperoxidase
MTLIFCTNLNPTKGDANMQPRIDYRKYAQEPLKSMLALEKYIAESGLEPKLIHLVKMRASQINGCAYCLDMHSLDAPPRVARFSTQSTVK